MKRHMRLLAYLSTMLLLSGCSSVEPTVHKKSHPDGTIISFDRIHVPNVKDLNTYKMMYWSADVKTEAFLAVPKRKGTYPLSVECESAKFGPSSRTHVWFDYKDTLRYSEPNIITILPVYRGYVGSGGTIHGINGDTLDVNNAIKAIMSRYSVEKNQVYLWGIMVGGGVALNIAAERKDIRSAVIIDPYVGMDIFRAWAEKYINGSEDQKDAAKIYLQQISTYHISNSHDPRINEESIDYRKISAPVLIIQEKNNAFIPNETVQIFYNKLRKYDARAQLKVIPYTYDNPNAQKIYNNWYNSL